MLKYHYKINYFKGEVSMSTELLQQIQPLIQSNPELKSQLVNYMTAYNIYYVYGQRLGYDILRIIPSIHIK